jgi:uncharacterized protein YndB with AHSA1/START domain
MANKFFVTITITINAQLSKVWKAITDPELIKEYMFGAYPITDWKKGSSITYTGVWQGKHYEDKGEIIDIVPDRLLHTTYWSSLSGKPDFPEYYANVIYELVPEGLQTIVHLKQDNIQTEDEKKHLEENWKTVLDGMKKLLEKQPVV